MSSARNGPAISGKDEWTVRPASTEDHRLVSSLLAGASWKHHHLDWLSALELLGSTPYCLAFKSSRLIGCLACPPDIGDICWIRLFVVASGFSLERMWDRLWPQAQASARRSGAMTAAALPTADWMPGLLERAGFRQTNEVVFLEREGDPPGDRASEASIRPFHRGDIPSVAEVDHRSFDPLWKLSTRALEAAVAQATFATVAELEGRMVGYQISTASGLGAHLARLAVDPPHQRRGIGAQLVFDALRGLFRFGIRRVSVNTQADNHPSLQLYEDLGFARTGQSFPVFTLDL